MQKDVIYIDIDDDITAIIGKIKKSKQQIVAIVPPKRNGAMQSAVNLRLLEKMAKNSHKNVVIVTHNPALTALAAAAKIPVAKNLESKPEIIKLDQPNKVEKDEIIDGANIAIGDHANLSKVESEESSQPIIKVHNNTLDEAVDTIEESELSALDQSEEPKKIEKTSLVSKIKVPDFGSFRKKLILSVIALIILIPAIIWAVIFAPSAKVIITAKTSPQTISETVTLSTTAPTDVTKNILHVIEQKISDKPMSVDFTATGTADVGNKATGTITLKNCDSEFTLPAGTIFKSSSNSLLFKTTSQVVVPAFTGSGRAACTNGSHPGASSKTISVIADKSGTSYNIDADTFSSNAIGSYLAYASGSAMSGGTTKISTVVTAEDVQKAKEQLVGLSTSANQDQLKSLFSDQQVYILESFNIDRKDATSVPAIGEDAAGTSPKLTSLTTFTMYGINKSDLNSFLDGKLATYLEANQNQKIYNNGTDSVKFNTFVKNNTSFTVGISTIAKVGPEVKESDVKMLAAGKKYGDVQSALESIPGVDSVDTKFSYFWVSVVPNDQNKITVEFNLDNGSN